MARIVAAVFEDQTAADLAVDALFALDCAHDRVDCFKLNAPGQHQGLPLGGDVDADAGARGGEGGALAGAAVGSALGALAGAAATPLAGPAALVGGLAAGAYAGSLAGALNQMGNADPPAVPPERPAGIMVAVNAEGPVGEDVIVEVLYDNGARFIELARGHWRDGEWLDFDPVVPPREVAFDATTH